MADNGKEVKRYTLPEGRLINHALFVKEAYKPEKGEPGAPKYKVELAFDPADVEGEGTIEDALLEAAIAEWGPGAEDMFMEDKIILPYISGDRLAENREAKGKPGDAYKGKTVIRADTIYNKDGQDGPGGVQVYGPNVEDISFMEKDLVYQGCYGVALVNISCYTDNRGNKAMKFYLNAFQKTRDGEKFVTPQNHAGAFKPVGRTEAAAGEGASSRRRSRAG